MTPAGTPVRRPKRSGFHRRLCPARAPIFTTLAWSIVLVSYLAIIFAYACPQDFHNTSEAYVRTATAAFMIRTFLFQLGLLPSAIAIIAALMHRWRLLLAALPLVFSTVGPALWSYRPQRQPAVAGETLTLMSVNLLAQNRLTAPIVAEVVAAKPDVLLLQEYTPNWHRAFQAALGADYPYTSSVQRADSFGLAIYSRRPFIGPVDMNIPLGAARTPQARAVLRISGHEVVFYNVHLMPPKRHDCTAEQRREFADLLERLKREDLPIVLCGDFNFTNASAFADRLRRLGLIDVHRISGRGRGSTWPIRGPLRWLPGIRLDHIFLSKELTSTHSRTGTGQGSDHRPIIARIGFAQ